MIDIEGEVAGGLKAAEARARADLDRQHIIALARGFVEQYVAAADLRERIAFLGQLERDRRLGPLDALGDDRLADRERESILDQGRRQGRVGLDVDRREAVALPRRQARKSKRLNSSHTCA